MSSLNRVDVIGRLGQDPEVRYTANGAAVTNISVATSEKWKDKNTGDQQERTEWHRITFFGKLAEIAGEYLSKGRQVFVSGRLQTDKWTDKQGVERYTTKIIGNQMTMLGDRQSTAQPANEPSEPSGVSENAPASEPDFDDDIPF